MLVGKSNIELHDLLKHIQNAETFTEYCDSLVPSEFRHVQAIIDNQRYLCCLMLRQAKTVDWSVKSQIIENVMCDIKIIGFTDMIIEVNTLFGLADKERILQFGRKVGT